MIIKNKEKIVINQISQFRHYTLKKNLIQLKAIKNIEFYNNELYITIVMPFPWKNGFNKLKRKLNLNLLKITRVKNIHWKLINKIKSIYSANDVKSNNNIKNIISINSCKGGVGKSTVSMNLALSLINDGAKVGILDADFYGSSIPTMIGNEYKKIKFFNNYMIPIKKYELYINSINYLVNKQKKNNSAVILRGPIISKIFIQMLHETIWPKLDYLIIDMPPGTGDIQLTLAKNINFAGIILVTTSQNISLLNVTKTFMMFKKLNLNIIGIIENMSFFICKNCGKNEKFFGENGAKIFSQKYEIPLLGKLPFYPQLCNNTKLNVPFIIKYPNSKISFLYKKISSTLVSNIYWQHLKKENIFLKIFK